MKKTYIAPSVKVQKIDATEIICISTRGFTDSTSGNLGKDRGSRQSDDDDFDDLW